jgi:hypothetical protein
MKWASERTRTGNWVPLTISEDVALTDTNGYWSWLASQNFMFQALQFAILQLQNTDLRTPMGENTILLPVENVNPAAKFPPRSLFWLQEQLSHEQLSSNSAMVP